VSLRTALLPVADRIRALGDTTRLDIRRYEVRVRSRSWSGGALMLGVPTITDVVVTPRPKVIENGRRVTVTAITPAYVGGGWAPAQLNPADNPAVEFYYMLTGPDGTQRPFALLDLDTTRPFTYTLRLMALDRKVPF
jgi:hypothetical protein